jgi:cellulose synthase/poly-beta-1,6-N-acetylglucosamine synthase-like glycosyltransferase
MPRMALLILIVVVAVCQFLMALLLPWNRFRTPRLPTDPVPAAAPSVYILVPARNEEANIEACVRSLLSQNYPNLRIRVIDDHSSDRTAAIVSSLCREDPRLELYEAPTLPPGWRGKPHALHVGAQGLLADYLLFVDADVRLQKDAVRATVTVAEKTQAGLVTLVPRLLAESFWERAVQPVIALILFSLLDPVKVRDPDSEVAVGYGPFMFFRRTAYLAIGGHAAVAKEIVEDLRLAQLIKAARLPLAYVHGVEAVDLRMYDSLRALISGWKKNFHIALGHGQWFAPIGAALLALVFAGPTLALLGSAAWWLYAGGPLAAKLLAASLVCYAADWLSRLSLTRHYGITPRGVRSLGGLVVGYILCASSYQVVMGRPVVWRGRAY